ncbi:MAG TPA: bacteriohemerythrin [Bryobacteraceae bacterium]|nr:bacteriohemerythrin [Bryobacteraceae bacterium]
MSLFQWDESYSVGHSEIDTQHKRLFQLAEEMHAAMAAGKGKQMLSQTLTNLINYTKGHFSSEERLMKRYNYPEYPQHKVEHDKLTAQVLAFQSDFNAGRAMLSIDLMLFIKNWLTHHIGQIDKKVASYIKGKAA